LYQIVFPPAVNKGSLIPTSSPTPVVDSVFELSENKERWLIITMILLNSDLQILTKTTHSENSSQENHGKNNKK
jgi:hypothetical protein